MKKNNWYRALSFADDKYIVEAHPDNVIKPKKNKVFISLVAVCTCFILLFCAIWIFVPLIEERKSNDFRFLDSEFFDEVMIYADQDSIYNFDKSLIWSTEGSFKDENKNGDVFNFQFEDLEYKLIYDKTYNYYDRNFAYYEYIDYENQEMMEIGFDETANRIARLSYTRNAVVGEKISEEEAKDVCIAHLKKYAYENFDEENYEISLIYYEDISRYLMMFLKESNGLSTADYGVVSIYHDGQLETITSRFMGEFNDINCSDEAISELISLNNSKIKELYKGRNDYSITENVEKTIIKLSNGKLAIVCDNNVRLNNGLSESVRLIYTFK